MPDIHEDSGQAALRDLLLGSLPENAELRLDLLRPDAEGAVPAVVYLHRGHAVPTTFRPLSV